MRRAAKLFLITLIPLAGFALPAQSVLAAPDGEALYLAHCARCHQFDGTGWGFEIPTLVLSTRLRGKKTTLIEFVLHGSDLRAGFITESNIPMPAFKELPDDEIAALLTYARDAFGDHASAVTVDEVVKGRSLLGEILQNRKKQ